MEIVQAQKAPAAIGPYSQAIIANGFLYASGQIPLAKETGQMTGENIKEQTEQVIKNISAILEEAGATFAQVIKTTCFLQDMDDFNDFNEVYAKYFITKPARSCIGVARLPKNALVEIEIIAAL